MRRLLLPPPNVDSSYDSDVVGTSIEEGLVCYYNLTDSFEDSLGQFTPVNIIGTPTYVQALGRTVMFLDGNTFAQLPTTDFSGLITGPMTFSSHFCLTERKTTAQGLLCCYHGDWWISGLILHNDSSSGTYRYMVGTGSGQNESMIFADQMSPEVTLDTWHNLALTFDGSYLYMYLDGELFTGISATKTNFNSRYYYLGSMGALNNRGFVGMMSSTAVWNRCLTAEEINRLWNDGNGLRY